MFSSEKPKHVIINIAEPMAGVIAHAQLISLCYSCDITRVAMFVNEGSLLPLSNCHPLPTNVPRDPQENETGIVGVTYARRLHSSVAWPRVCSISSPGGRYEDDAVFKGMACWFSPSPAAVTAVLHTSLPVPYLFVTTDTKRIAISIRLIPDEELDPPLLEVMLMILTTQAKVNGCHDILALFETFVEFIS